MKIEFNKSLKRFNTFGIEAYASEFIQIHSEIELISVLKSNQHRKIFVLSGGSNMLLTKNIEALVLHIYIKGISSKTESENTILVTAKAGENWHDFVRYCVDQDYGGLENLSLIPGYVGSAPIQNIGAYGVELKDVLESCEAIEIETGEKRTFSNAQCRFGYRNSIFKNELKGKYIITKVTFRLTTNDHKINTRYGAIEKELALKKTLHPTIKDISDVVVSIRKSKLPDPSDIGNSGSFFKNPIISLQNFKKLQQSYPDIPSYSIDENNVKVPAGWLIEQCGLKGKRWGDAGIHKNQALVLVNHGNASGSELLDLSKKIQETVHERFNIGLETEVNII